MNLRQLAIDHALDRKHYEYDAAIPRIAKGKWAGHWNGYDNYKSQAALDAIEQLNQMREFRVRDRDHLQVLIQARREIEMEIVPMAKRREFENRLAYFIATKVKPIYKHHDASIADLPEKLSNCRTCGRIGVNPQGDKRFFWDHKCNQGKLCPDEARYEASRLSEVYIPEILAQCRANKRIKLQKLVISPRNVPLGQLHETKRKLFQVFSNLNRRAVGKNLVGSLVTQEDPLAAGYAPGGGTSWNVHLNALILVGGHFDWGEYRREFANAWGDDDVQVDFKTEKDMWRLSEGRQKNQGIPLTRELVLMDAIREMVKYATKITGSDHDGTPKRKPKIIKRRQRDDHVWIGTGGVELEAAPMDEWQAADWFEWWRSNKGFRRTRSYGSLYRFEKVELPEAENCQPIALINLNASQRAFFYEISGCPIDLIPADNFANSPPDYYPFDHYRGPPG